VLKVGGIQMPVNRWGWERRPKPIGSAELFEATPALDAKGILTPPCIF
jgi:hypothetical protein